MNVVNVLISNDLNDISCGHEELGSAAGQLIELLIDFINNPNQDELNICIQKDK